jgi:hypothetical protein
MSVARCAFFTWFVVLVACTTHSLDVGSSHGADAGQPPPVPVGAPCIPSPELSTSFLGFQSEEVVIDRGNAACGAGVCLANHFQGRASCPYGQNESATAAADLLPGHTRCGNGTPAASGPCCVPGSDEAVLLASDAAASTPSQSEVLPQCLDRQATRVVTCSCRCANAAGKTDDGAEYCACPSGTTCSQLVPELIAGDPLAGGYCVLEGTGFDISKGSCSNLCGISSGNCAAPAVSVLPDSRASASAYFALLVGVGLESAGGESNPGCVLSPLTPTDTDGEIGCQVYIELAAGDSCAQHPGLASADSVVQAAILDVLNLGPTVCQLPQLPPPCTSSSQIGWCYTVGAAAVSATGCPQAVRLSAAATLPAGAHAIFACP